MMDVENTQGTEEQVPKVKAAKVGDTIQPKKGDYKGFKGIVMVVRDNSVIVDFGKDAETGESMKTVVNHKNYKIVKK
ncbi:DUF2187 family protein [Priestia megaterium]|uniref:DUF2187 family protein n=1 Tax=Priestia megaterium TaxID=1404 RepID=UPI000BF8A589|nr:DUF2187 family protein [Priestia megaterium]PFI87671.1 hypothetical protein COI84_25545 [Priestia megaterium]PGR08262.1 hypothetical protein COC62_25825 [Priestia megaterium]